MYQQFIAFVNRMRASRNIKHSVGWCGCAVGEFVKTLDYDADVHDVVTTLVRVNPRLLGALNIGSLRSDMATYGDLQNYIANLDDDPLTEDEHSEAIAAYHGPEEDWAPVYT